MAATGRLLRQAQSYREPERVAHTAKGAHWVPTVIATGAAVPLELPAELRPYTDAMTASDRLSLGWVDYPA